MNGVVNFLKPPGMTSSDAVVWLRWVLGTRKCGHGGTLDPAACGVLPVLVGQGTKLFDRMLGHEKTYAATLRFGAATDTLDAQGTVTARTDAIPTKETLLSVLPKFAGQIEQIPPLYSAIRIDGRHAYELARNGKEAEVPKRTVTIREIGNPVWMDEKTATIRVRCSSGTYIRTLAADIARECGSLAYLSALTREKSGDLSIDDAWRVEELLKLKESGRIAEAVTPMDELLRDIPACRVTEEALTRAVNGAAIPFSQTDKKAFAAGESVRLLTPQSDLIGICRAEDDERLHMKTMLYLKK